MKKKLAIGLIIILVCGIVGYSYLTRFYVVPILMYHFVNDKVPDNTSVVSCKAFARHMEYIYRHGYEVISLDELVESIKAGEKIKRNKVVITFDDGYEDNFVNAFPVLVKYSFPATIFLAAGDVGSKEGLLSWDQIRLMLKHGITYGAHAMDIYAYVPDYSSEKQIRAVFGSKKILEEKIGVPILYFSYPGGGFTDKIKQMVKDAGYKGAVATNRGFDRLNRDIYALKRIKMTNKDVAPLIIWAKLSGFYNLFRKLKVPD